MNTTTANTSTRDAEHEALMGDTTPISWQDYLAKVQRHKQGR